MSLANAVTFDGANDYLTRGGDLDGASDSKLWSWSFWLKRNTISTDQRVLGTNGDNIRIALPAANDRIVIQGQNAAGTTILSIRTSALTDTAGWHHCCGSVDMASGGVLFLDDVSDYGQITFTDDSLDFTQSDHAIGALPTGSFKLDADLAEVWIAPGVLVDFSDEATRRRVVTADLKAVYLGPDGSFVTGTAPAIYLANPAASWETNLGTGGGFTENGALASATGPDLVPPAGVLAAATEAGRAA